MEACPRLPVLNFDLKLSIESVNLCEKIPNYITANYQENGEAFSNECEQINRLRQNAINCSMDEASVQYLKRYYCQLQLLRNRFPMLPDTECSVRFTWEDGFQKEDNTYNDIRFEEACILYNIGALYSKLGTNEPRRSHESMKNACTYFRYASACFEKLRDQYTPYSVDCTPDILTCQVDILLAQAHEAVLEKSFLDQRPPSVHAHVAMQISEYYQMALVNLMKPGINSILSKKFREWRVALTYKISYYLSITYYCCGLISEESKKHGEAVCYLENAVERLKDAWKSAEKISTDRTAVYKDAHTFTNDIVMGKYKSVKRDNDSVYFEKVPALSSLPAVHGAIVAKSQAFDCHDPDVCGTDIFQKLIPIDAHLIASEYSEEKAKVLREMMELTEDKSRELETFMLCLQLDRIPLNNEYLRLPRELLDCCAAVQSRPNMAKDLVSAMQQLNSQHHDVSEELNEFEQSLQTFQETHDSTKSNKEVKDLQNTVKAIRDMMSQANENNVDLHRHMTTMIEHFKLLNSPVEQLDKSLPTLSELNDENNKIKLARLNLLNEKIETMKKQRESLVSDFRKKIQDDDITKLVLMQRQDNHKNLFSSQMKKHEELISIIKQNCAAQDNIVQAFTDANAEIADIRTNLLTKYENRQRLIQELIHSCKSFDESQAKANEGMEFYKKQNVKLSSLNERLRTLEKQQQQLPPALPPPSTKPAFNPQIPSQYKPSNQDADVPTIPDRPRLKDYLAAMKPDTWGATTSRPSSKLEEHIYNPSSMSNMCTIPSSYTDRVPSSGPVYSHVSHMTGQTFTSLPTFNAHPHYQMQSQIHSEQPPMPFVPPSIPATQSSLPYSAHYSVPNQQPVYSQSQSSAQNFGGSQPPMAYNLPPHLTQPFAQQQNYTSQVFQSQQPTYQPPPTQNIPTHHSGQPHPSIYQYRNYSDSNHSTQQSLPPLPARFDPYRPQPVGAYDIPNPQQTTIGAAPLINPQDVYRPGGLLGMNQTLMSSISSSNDNNGYDPNQFVQYNPPANSVSVPFSNLSIN